MGFYSFSIFSLFQDNTCINTQHLRMFSMANKNCSNPLFSSIKMVKKKLSSSSYCKIADTSNSEVYSFSLAKILDFPPWICLWVFCPPESSSLEGKRFVSFFPSFLNWDCWALETVLTVLDPVWCLLLWPTGECTFYTNGLFYKWVCAEHSAKSPSALGTRHPVYIIHPLLWWALWPHLLEMSKCKNVNMSVARA